KPAGYAATQDLKSMAVFENEGGIFPSIIVWDGGFQLTLKVESVADFLAANQLDVLIEGPPLADLRQATICDCAAGALLVMERHGVRAHDTPPAARNPGLRRTHVAPSRLHIHD